MTVSSHAYKRAKERLGWSKSTIDKMWPHILQNQKSLYKGKLKKYLDGIRRSSKCKVTVYGEVVYIYSKEGKLITVFQLNSKYHKYLKL